MQTASFFSPVPNLRLKWNHYAKIGSYLMIFFIFKKIFPYHPDFGWFLAEMGVLGHFEAKKCANCLYIFTIPKIQVLNGATVQKLDPIS